MKFKKLFLNSLYFISIFIFAIGLTTFAMYQRYVSFTEQKHGLVLAVEKQEAKVDSLVSGRVQNIYIQPGQEVEAGDIMMTIQAFEYEELPESIADGVYELTAPVNGIVEQIETTIGSSIRKEIPLVILSTNEDPVLVGEVSRQDYLNYQKFPDVEVYSDRLNSSYLVTYKGLVRIEDEGIEEEETYTLHFTFSDKSIAQIFIDGERLVLQNIHADYTNRPERYIVNFWSKVIKGNS